MSTSIVTLAVETLSDAHMDALAAKFAKQPKSIKRDVRALEVEGSEAIQYAAYILRKNAQDYINSQMRDIWVQRLETLIPRLTTKDEKLAKQTKDSVASIALEIEDLDMRGEIQQILKKNLLPRSTDIYNLVKCFDALEQVFKTAWAEK